MLFSYLFVVFAFAQRTRDSFPGNEQSISEGFYIKVEVMVWL